MTRTLSHWILVVFTWNTLVLPLPRGFAGPDGDEEHSSVPSEEIRWEGHGLPPKFNVFGRTMFEVWGVETTWDRDDLQDVKKFHLKNLRSTTPTEPYRAVPARYADSIELVQHIWDVFSETKTRDLYKRFLTAVGPELQAGHGEIHAQLMHQWKEHRYRHAEYFDRLTKEQIYTEFKSFFWKSEWKNLYDRKLLDSFQPAGLLREDRIGAMVFSHLTFAKGAMAVATVCAALVVGYSWGSAASNPGPQERATQRLNMEDLSRVHANPDKNADEILEGARSRGELFEAQFP